MRNLSVYFNDEVTIYPVVYSSPVIDHSMMMMDSFLEYYKKKGKDVVERCVLLSIKKKNIDNEIIHTNFDKYDYIVN